MNKKKMTTSIITVMMVLAIFAVMIGPASAGSADLSKKADKHICGIGEDITYTLEVTNTDENGENGYTWTFDVYDKYAFDSEIWVTKVTNLAPGATWIDTITFTVDQGDITNDGWVKNTLRYEGKDSLGKPVGGYCAEWVEVDAEVTFDFDYEATGCMKVKFTGSSTGPVDWHEWVFGDGSSSGRIDGAPDGKTVTHTYATDGDKTVTLKGKSTFGDEYGEVVKTVYVKRGPTAKATVNPACVYKADDPATFSSNSTPGDSPIVSYHWTFSDGQYESTSETVTRPIPEDGVTATLTVNDSLDCEDTDDVKTGVCVEYVGCAIRMYGFLDKGAGDRSIDCENPPYTNAMDPFWPQADQAPEKDFLTFNPIVMQHGDKDWDNDGMTDYVYRNSIKNNNLDANEKEFFRMWYEPVEWIKDENGDGEFDVVLTNDDVVTIDEYEANLLNYLDDGIGIKPFNENKPERIADVYAPTIKQEFTFMFLDTNNNPISAPTGTSKFLIPMASWVNDNGIDSFDADGDGTPDPVLVCSEANLGDVNSDGIPDFLDIDGDGLSETLSDDGCQLTEDDTLVLRLNPKTLKEGERIQFFDFEIELVDTTEAGRVRVNIYYRGNPNSYGDELIAEDVNLHGDLLPALGESVATFERGGVNMHVSPRGPGFIWVTDVDWEDDTATIIIGRMFGNTHENIGDMYNDGESAWAYQKHFYVDGVLYNVVAIMTEGHENLKYVTFRAKLVKVPLWIENHSNQLVGWAKDVILPVMPQFNMKHAIMKDVADVWDLEKKGPVTELYTPLTFSYISETTEPRFHGELREILGEPCDEGRDDGCYPWDHDYEGWWIDWFQTIPYQYTEFVLPDADEGHGPYLMTSAFYGPESVWAYHDGDLMDDGRGSRLKFWYDDCTGPLFIDDADDSVRIYGFLDKGAGDRHIECENPPYTNAMDPFWPQADQAPRKDFITFNPVKMAHSDYDWDNDGVTDYVYRDSIKAGLKDADEKEFFRMWYEPVEWIKDEDCDREFDVVLTNGVVTTLDEYEANLLDYLNRSVGIKPFNENKPERIADIYAPTIKQEFTFMFLDTNNDPISAPTGTSKFLVPMASEVDDNGIDSFDADGDGAPDSVLVCSEANLGDVNNDGIPDFLDIDGDMALETLSDDGCQLTEDDTLVLRLDPKTLKEGERLQFFDFEIELVDTTEAGRAKVNIYYRGNPNSYGDELIGTVNLGADLLPTLGESVATFERGGVNMHISPRGPGFIWVTDVDWEDDTATIIIGRMFGNTHENIGCMYEADENAWAYQKHFYVDGVLYNVVAILTDGQENLKYVTFRAKLVKVPLWIENHSNQLVGWDKNVILPMMPQFNMNHAILNDVWASWDHVKKGEPAMDAPPLDIEYTAEEEEPRFHGELREILGEPCDVDHPGDPMVDNFDGCYPWAPRDYEGWWIDWFQTIPYQYTAFNLPEGHGLYLITSAFRSNESVWAYHDGDEKMPDGRGSRVKFWYDPADPADIYVNRIPAAHAQEPDLKITAVTCGDDYIDYTVENIGDAGAGAQTVGLYIDGVLEDTDDVESLGIGGSYDGSIAYTCTDEVTVKVCADDDDDVIESDETNNCMEVTCGEGPIARYDADGNGYIDKPELKTAILDYIAQPPQISKEDLKILILDYLAHLP